MGMEQGDELREQGLTAALWFVNHRIVLRKILIIALAAVCAGFWGYAIFGIARDIFQISSRRASEQELLNSGAALSGHAKASAPEQIALEGVETLSSGEVTDVIVRLRNTNANWHAKFRYTLAMGAEHSVHGDGFLLPGEERIFFNSFRGGGISAPDFRIGNVSWSRIDSRTAPDLAAFTAEHLNFDVQNPVFVPAQMTAGKIGADRATFTITNKTAYGFYQPKFLVLLYRGERVVGVQSTVLDNFKSGETRNVEVSWFDRVGAVSRVEAAPEIDIFDAEAYLRVETISSP